jgi:transposase
MERDIQKRVTREVRAMTKREVIVKAIEGSVTWLQAADLVGVSARQMRRLKRIYETRGYAGLLDHRGGRPKSHRLKAATIAELCRLKRQYADFSVKHFHEFATERHGLKVSYTATKLVLQAAGLSEKAPGRGKYRRKRERRPLVGMMVHLDASTHEWIAGLPRHDLVLALDDADSRILFARFVEQEGTVSTLEALSSILRRYGRFCELYTDRGSHFCRTDEVGRGPAPEQNGQVSRVLKALGIRHILAHSPQARGRSERMFQTVQGRLPQELRAQGIRDYAQANVYLETVFVPDLNSRFTVEPAQRDSGFVKLAGLDLDLDLLLSVQHERVVGNDNTVAFQSLSLQLTPTATRRHYARCPVLVHEFLDATLGVTYQGRRIARFDRHGRPLPEQTPRTQRRA